MAITYKNFENRISKFNETHGKIVDDLKIQRLYGTYIKNSERSIIQKQDSDQGKNTNDDLSKAQECKLNLSSNVLEFFAQDPVEQADFSDKDPQEALNEFLEGVHFLDKNMQLSNDNETIQAIFALCFVIDKDMLLDPNSKITGHGYHEDCIVTGRNLDVAYSFISNSITNISQKILMAYLFSKLNNGEVNYVAETFKGILEGDTKSSIVEAFDGVLGLYNSVDKDLKPSLKNVVEQSLSELRKQIAKANKAARKVGDDGEVIKLTLVDSIRTSIEEGTYNEVTLEGLLADSSNEELVIADQQTTLLVGEVTAGG